MLHTYYTYELFGRLINSDFGINFISHSSKSSGFSPVITVLIWIVPEDRHKAINKVNNTFVQTNQEHQLLSNLTISLINLTISCTLEYNKK